MYRYRLLAYCLLSIIGVIFAPQAYNYIFCILSVVLYILVSVDSLISGEKSFGYLNFSLLFTVFLFITSFLIPVFLFKDGAYLFYARYVCKATALCTLAICFYYLGRYYSLREKSEAKNNFCISQSMIRICNVLTIFIMLLYLVSFRSFLAINSGSNDLEDRYLVTLLYTVPTLSLILSTVYNKTRINGYRGFIRYNRVSIYSICFVILSSLYIGDRTIPLYLSLCVLFVYIQFVKKIKTSYLILIALSFGLLFYTIGQTRSGDNSLREAGIKGMLEQESSTEKVIDYFSDFYPASEANYLFVKWRSEKDGKLYYPGKIFIYMINPIPFLPSALAKLFYDVPYSELSSGYLSTELYRQSRINIDGGIGTHAVGDIYISWGVLGIMFFFCLLGMIVGSSYNNINNNVYAAMIYMSLFAGAIYMSRASLFDCYRTFAFQIIVYYLIKKLVIRK